MPPSSVRGVGWGKTPLPSTFECDGSKADEPVWRDKSDLDGKADCEKGVVGDVKLAEVLDAPLVVEGKAVVSCGGACAATLAEVAGLFLADSSMYVSTHFAAASRQTWVLRIADQKLPRAGTHILSSLRTPHRGRG